MKKNIILVSALFYSLFNAQGIQNYKDFGNNFFPQSPNTTPFALTGKYPVNMYKGVPNINIPLFNTENTTVSLDYNVKSVKPSTIPTWTGLGWNLNAGGAITRVINDTPDEYYQSSYPPYDRFAYLDHYSILDNPSWNSLQTLGNYHAANLQLLVGDNPQVLPNPDEFIINIGGLTGSFYLNEKGKWIGRTREGKTFKVEHFLKSDFLLTEKTIVGGAYSGTRTQNIKRVLYGFTITLDDGTKYIFGQDDTALEFTSSVDTSDSFNPQVSASSWQIKQIIYPDGTKTDFTYERDQRGVFIVNQSKNSAWYTQGTNNGSVGNSHSGGDPSGLNANRTSNVFLKKIEGEDFIITFNRSEADQKEYEQFEVPTSQWIPPYTHHFKSYWQLKHWYKLDGISVTDKAGRQVKNIVFNYNNDPTDRLLLNNVTINGIEKYGFAYNAQKLPKYTSSQTDGWGFYNGNNFDVDYSSLNTMTPAQQRDLYVNIYPTYKMPNLNLTKASTLEQITYPTGGITTFEYELNDYSKYGDKDLTQPSLKINPTVSNQIAGGLRIKKIKSCSEANNCINKTYSYLNDNGTTSSGILPYKPVYVIEGIAQSPSYTLTFWEFNSNSYQNLKDEDNSVGYSKVTEIDDNGGKIENYYTNLADLDLIDKGGGYFGWRTSALYKQLPYLSFALMRGKPAREVIYSNTKKIKETFYSYTQQTDYLRAYTFVARVFGQIQTDPDGPFTDLSGITYGSLLDGYFVNFNTSFLNQKYTWFEGVETTENFTYNYAYNLVNSKTRFESDDNNYSTSYKYPSDINNQKMIDAYMVGVTVSEEQKKNNKTISKTESVYPTALPTTQTGNLLLPLSIKSYDVLNNTPSTEVTSDKYDSKGNVQQYTTKEGVPISIVWGYNQTQPIAKVEGATYDQLVSLGLVTAIVNASDADATNPANESALITALDNFRKNSGLLAYQVSTYTYDPLIGVTSITPPSGIREIYVYDTANRLKEVKVREKDNAGNYVLKTVKEFKYNYKP